MRFNPLMLFRAALPAALFAAWFTPLTAATDPAVATRRVQAHTTFLADDLLEGRGTGTRGYDLAARYVASQFARIGLEPGADGYEQPVKLLEATNALEAGHFVIRHAGQEDTLVAINDMLAYAAFGQTAAEVTGEAVFIGFGVQAPELGYDDYAGVDLKGKIAVYLSGAPTRFPSDQRAHHSSGDQKRALAVQHGAIGVVSIMTPRDEARYPWAVAVAQSRFPSMRLVNPDGSIVGGFPELRALASVSRAGAARLLVASGRTAEEVFAQAERGEPQSFPLNVELTFGGTATLRSVASSNVLGWLPGSDPALAREPIVVTGHLDHLGIGTAIDGDAIYNGAMDNGIGIGLILSIAEDLAAGPRLARPILFAALTAEEVGLLGATHLALNPPDRVTRFAANVNIDMTLFPAPVRDIVPWGAEHSTLATQVAAAAAKTGFTVSPDPMPDETIFVRSDQYAFVRTGVPAVYIGTGRQSTDPAVDLAAEWETFLKQRYHRPSDDFTQPIDWPSTGAYATLVTELLTLLGNDPQAPAWLPGNFFGGLYGPKQN
jgi:Zn-dependent M28 family amino/carboxypeptidase